METKTYEEIIQETGFLYWKTVGISMRPLIREGKDTVLIKKRPTERLKKYDTVLYRRPGVVGRGAYVLHRILRVNPNGTYWIVGDNCSSGETVREEDVFGVLSAVVRGGKKISVTDRGYLFYVHLWCDCYPIRMALVRFKFFVRTVFVRGWHLIKRIFHIRKK